MAATRGIWGVAAGSAAVVVVVGGWLLAGAEPEGSRAVLASTTQRQAATSAALLAPTPASQRDALRGPEAFGRWLERESSLRGTELDGSWDVDGQGAFHPTLALRRRFDQLLTLAGEAKVDEISAFIEHEVRELVGAPAASAVTDAWQRYVELQRQAFHSRIDPRDRQSLMAALAERQQARRRILGPELAQAFFADEEAQLQAMQQAAPLPVADAHSIVIDRTSLSPQALARLQKADADWADWQRRLEQARRDVGALQAAAELSDTQRRAAIERLLAQRFDPQETIRVRALLQLPPPAL